MRIAAVEANPASGNQAEEYVCLTNPAPFAVDISGWRLKGAVRHTFPPGTVIRAHDVMYVSPDVAAFRARSTPPHAGMGLFAQGNYQGQLSARGETLEIEDTLGRLVDSFTYTVAPSPVQQYLRITEIMYNPSGDGAGTNAAQAFEFIELKNIGSEPLDLNGVRFVNAIEFDFTASAVTNLAAGESVVVVGNKAAFVNRYGSNLRIAGEYAGYLDNAGERIQLVDAQGEEVLDFTYNNAWYPITDGLGFSLVVTDAFAEPDRWSSRSQWRPSGYRHGSPAANEPTPPELVPVVVNEALARTETPPPLDSVELYNPSDQPADLSGWYLTDDFFVPAKYRIPDGTVLGPGEYVVFDENHFNTGLAAFALNAAGDEIYLFSADADGNLTGYVHGFRFRASEDDVSFGRHVVSTGEEQFVAQSALTLGAPNAGPRIGPVVISEIMYHPTDDDGSEDAVDGEFIELLNISEEAVPLFDVGLPTNTWRLTGGVDWVAPTNLTLETGAAVLLVKFDPTDTAASTAFRTRYGVPSNVPLLGPYKGRLANDGETVSLKKPSVTASGEILYVTVDKVQYSDTAPWPVGADGFGLSLQRREPAVYGNDPVHWTAASPTPGAAFAGQGEAPVLVAQSESQTVVAWHDLALEVQAMGTGPLAYQWRFNGQAIQGATNATLLLESIEPQQTGDYDVVVYNEIGSVVSEPISVRIVFPPAILGQPAPVQVQPGEAAGFEVVAYSAFTLHYQWYHDGTPIPGATNASYAIPSADLEDVGQYTVTVSDEIGSVTSRPARLQVLVDPFIVVPPLSIKVVPGESVTLSVQVTNTATLPIGYRWRRNGVTIAHHVLDSYVDFLSVPAVTEPGYYTVVATNAAFSRPGFLSRPVAVVEPATDDNGNGLPDDWESAHGGALDPADDSDGDGMTNREEYQAATDPHDPASVLRLDIGWEAARITLTLRAQANRTYTIQYSDRLGGLEWHKLEDFVARSAGYTAQIVDMPGMTNRYYRVVTPQQP